MKSVATDFFFFNYGLINFLACLFPGCYFSGWNSVLSSSCTWTYSKEKFETVQAQIQIWWSKSRLLIYCYYYYFNFMFTHCDISCHFFPPHYQSFFPFLIFIVLKNISTSKKFSYFSVNIFLSFCSELYILFWSFTIL